MNTRIENDMARGFSISPRGETGPAPLSFSQERLWFLEQYYPGSPLYNIPAPIPLAGLIDESKVASALNEIVQRHAVLRTRFVAQHGRPFQVIDPMLRLDVPLIDLTSRPEQQRQTDANAVYQQASTHIFDLAKGPLIRASLVRLRPDFHYLILVIHHIISDAWSMRVLTREFFSLYQSLSLGQPSSLEPLRIQYADFAVWQRKWLHDAGLLAQLPYWRDRLSDVVGTVIDLPTDRPRPSSLSFRGASLNFSLPLSLSERLSTLARQKGATLFMVLLAGFHALLYRYTGQSTVLVGIPSANRNRTEIESLIGFFVNTLVIRSDFSDDLTFQGLVDQIKRVTLEALTYQDLPFERLVEELQPTRTLNINPLVQVMFDLHISPSAQHSSTVSAEAEARTTITWETSLTSKFDLSLSMAYDGRRLMGGVEFNTDLFDPPTIIRLVGHFQRLLTEAVMNPRQRIAELSLLCDDEIQQEVQWNATGQAFRDQSCLHQLFEEQVNRAGSTVAVLDRTESLTYAELNRRANRLAHYLQSRGIGPERVVGVCVDGGVELVVSVFAVLKAGGAYLPLDPSYPRERLLFMVKDVSASLILAQTRFCDQLEGLECPIFALDGHSDSTVGYPETDPVSGAQHDNACYVIYTSGSTGRPKGVVVTHSGVVNLVQYLAAAFDIGVGSRVLQASSFSFDVSVREVFESLLTGATLCLDRRENLIPPASLLRVLQDQGITTVTLSPSVWAHLPDAALPGLQTAIAGGAACPPTIVDRWGRTRSFFNAYGPTEITVASSIAHCIPDGRKPTIGKPIANMRYYVVDRNLQLVPIGILGELLIGGIGLARGYFGRPALTAERFIPDPFSGIPGARLYRSGDLVRRLPDGDIDFVGRIDDQVEIRGFRIELGEIESVLLDAPDVSAATVICHVDSSGGKELVAYAVTGQATVASIRSHLASVLPEYMVPSIIIRVDNLPLTAAGKIDRKALPSPENYRRQDLYVEPTNSLERLIVEFWSEILGAERVGIKDNFFELGGHSLLAAQVVSRLREALQIDLPLRTLFEFPTPAQLSDALQADSHEEILERAHLVLAVGQTESVQFSTPEPAKEQRTEADPISTHYVISKRPENGPIALSFAQERLWFLAQFDPLSPAYNILAPLSLQEPIDFPALERSINAVVLRHEALRTTFEVQDDRPVQIVRPELKIPLQVADFTHLNEQGPTASAAFINSETVRPFDLQRGPLIRTMVVRPTEREAMLVLIMHHIVSDAWSLRVLLRDLTSYYEAFGHGTVVELPKLRLQYADYASWQRSALRGTKLRDQVEYWRQQLALAPPMLDLPTDRPRPSSGVLQGATEPFIIPAWLNRRLDTFAREEGATLFMTLLAAFMLLLHRWTGHDRVPVGTPIANRNHADIENVVGFFTNTLVLCGNISGALSFRVLLQHVRELTLGAFAHADLPFEKLVQELNPHRNLSVNPLFQVMFILQHGLRMVQASGGPNRLPQQGGVAKFDLTLYLEEADQGLFGAFEYASDMFDRSTIQRLISHFVRLLEVIAEQPDSRTWDLNILTDAERSLVAKQWANGPQLSDSVNRSIVPLIADQIARTPQAAAVSWDGQTLTYDDIDRLSNATAHRLVAAGLQCGQVVGIALPRGPLAAISLLAVIKAGGCYLSLDPGLPARRLEFIISDARPAIVLASAETAGLLPATSAAVLQIPDGAQQEQVDWFDTTSGAVDAESSCYVVYTSGTTGIPKGVLVPHRTIAELLQWQLASSALSTGSRTLQYSSPNFDVFLQEILATWCSGGELVYLPEEERRDMALLVRRLGELRISRIFMPFAGLQELAEAALNSPGTDLSGLREIVTAGEQLKITPAIVQMFERLQGAVLRNQYGPSESHVVTEQVLEGNPREWPLMPPIGRPVAGARVYILDRWQNLVQPGAAGEIYIGGSALARGYLNQSGLTADRFLPDAFGEVAGQRLYRTGDRARHRANGEIDFLGRTDDQLKIQGFRVELGEIEARLTAIPTVSEAAVVARNLGSSKQLAAYVAVTEGCSLSRESIRAELRTMIPDYMMPREIVLVDALPRTMTGKVDRLLLQSRMGNRPELAQEYVAPGTPSEQAIAKVWSELLGCEVVGIHDNFFELGGHSLLAAQLVSRMRNMFAVELPLRVIFEAPTVAGLALAVLRVQADGRSEEFDLDALIAEVEQVSDSDIAAMAIDLSTPPP